MNRNRTIGATLLWAFLMPSGAAFAMGERAAGQAPTHQPTQGTTKQVAPVSSPLQSGAVTALSARGDQIEIQGRWHRIEPGRTRFFRGGQVVQADAVKQGHIVKFTLVPDSGGTQTQSLGVVHVP